MRSGCGNHTWDVYCYQHPNGEAAPAQTAAVKRIASPYKPISDNKFPTHSSLSNLWASASKVFPDLADVIHPENLRSQAVDTIKAAISNETYRLFPLVDVADYQEREDRVEAARPYIRSELALIPLAITDDEAFEIANSSSDQYGRAIDDSGALASYAIRLEWETANILRVEKSSDGVPYGIPFNDFCEATAKSMDERVDIEYRKSLSGFEKFISKNFNRPPLNIGEFAPSLKLPEDETPWNSNPVQEEHAIMSHHNGVLQERAEAQEAAARAQRDKDAARAEIAGLGRTLGKTLLGIALGGNTPEERRQNKEDAAAQRRRESDHWDAQRSERIRTEAAKEQRDFYRRANGKRW